MPTGTIAYFADDQENALRISTAGRLYYSPSFSRLKNHSPINVTAASGGSTFESLAVGGVRIYSESGNNIMWIGGSANTSGATDCPYSGHGLPLYGGEQSQLLPVTNFDAVRVCASVSGQIVYAMGFLDGSDLALTNEVAEPPPAVSGGGGTPPPGDIGNPYVIGHSPTSGFSGVALGSEISVTFNETILQASVTSGSFALSPAANVTIYRDVTFENKIVMVPNGVNLSGSTQYVAGVNSQITDLSGNAVSGTSGGSWVFTFPFTTQAEADVTPPEVSGTNPADNATGVSAGTNVTVTFSESMASGTITPSNLYLSYTQGAIPASGIAAAVTLAPDLYTATINPTPALLNSNTEVFINVLSGVTDLYDNPMTANDDNRSFTTETFDTTKPTVTSTVPASGTSGVAVDTDVIVTFSEQVLSGTVNINTLYLSDISGAIASSGIPATVTLSGNNLSAEIDSSYSLSGGGTFYINVLSGITDIIGNNLSGGNFQGTTFTTIPGVSTVYDLLSGSNNFDLNGDNVMGGVYVATSATALKDSTPVRFTVKKRKVGNPTGTGRINIYNSSNSLMYSGSSLSFDVSTLSTSFTDYTYTDYGQSRTLQIGDYVAVAYSGGNPSNYVQVYYHNTDQISGTYFIALDSGGYDNITTFDFSMKIEAGTAGDTTAPTVTGTVPASGASGIAMGSNVVVTFSEGMLQSSINAQNIYLSYLSGVVPTSGISGVVTLSGNLLAAEINPTNNLSGNSNIHINILSGVRDYAGNNLSGGHDRSRVFSTETIDDIRPVVSGTTPLSGATEIAIASNVIITFSESVASGTIHGYNVYLSDISGAVAGSGIPAAVTLSGNLLAVDINPTSNLSTDKTYNINVLADVQDLAGNNMAAHDRSRVFTTIDTIPPTVSSTVPTSGASGVAITSDVMIVFSERMLSGTLTSGNLYLSNISGAIAASGIPATLIISGNNLAVEIDPTSSLANSTTYNINILSGVTDLAGNNLAAHDRSRVFTTTAITYTEIYNISSLGGSNYWSMSSDTGHVSRAGEKINTGSTMIGKAPKKFILSLAKSGSPTGTANLRIRNSSQTIVSEVGSIDVSTLTTSEASYTITNDSQSHTIANGDRIQLEYTGGNASNYIKLWLGMGYSNGQATYYSNSDSTQHDATGADDDIAWIIYY